ncbi:MAG: hypothetical protein L3J29_11475 [Cyclobacteriaceae bacterium]|nr:hypothetical protein [Cyclobacteriaceae bacterium]
MSEEENGKGNNIQKLDPKIEAIKEIIFGENIKEYEHEFQKLSAEIEKHKNELEQKLKEVKQETNSLFEESNKLFTTKIAELDKETGKRIEQLLKDKLDKSTYANLLIKMAKDITS